MGMRYVAMAVVFVTVLAFVCGCPGPKAGPEGGAGPTAPPPGPAAAKGTPAAPEAGAPAAGPKVVALKVGAGYDAATSEVTGETSEFKAEAKAIHVGASVSGVAKGDKIKGTLVAVDVTDKKGTVIRDYEVLSKEIVAPAEETTAHFEFSAPTAGWPKGTYAVRIAVGGKEIEKADLSVK
jgi:hypothetical protein